MKRLFGVVVGALGLLSVSPATVLIFETVVGAGGTYDGSLVEAPIYGHRVASEVQEGLLYGTAFGFTPNVSLSYTATLGTTPTIWNQGFGSTTGVVYGDGPQNGLNEVSLNFVADPGWLIDFRGFSVARWLEPSGYPGSYVTLTNANGVTVELFNQSIPIGQTINLSYADDTFVSSSFTLTFGQGWWTGLDNIAFAQQPVPEPMTMTLLAAGLVAVARRRRKA